MKNGDGFTITIITVCKNSGKFLEETIRSVTNQSYQNIEYIVIDGNSTDNTVALIEQYASKISIWLSEDDEGMYDAINKGLKLASGDFIIILNSDDVLATRDTIKTMAAVMCKKKLDYYYGNIIKSKDGNFKKVKLFNVTYKQLLLSTHGTFAPHPCFFISAKLNKILGGYDINYKFAADYDYILRALAHTGCRGMHIGLYITRFRLHEGSITASGKIDEERKKILLRHKYYQIPYLSRLFYYYTLWIYYKIINLGQKYQVG